MPARQGMRGKWEKTGRSCGREKRDPGRSQVNGTAGMGLAGGEGTMGRDMAGGRTLPCTPLLAAVCSWDQTTAFRENN